MKLLIAAAIFFFASAALADGWGGLGGTTDAGDYIGVSPCDADPTACSDPPPPDGFAVYIHKKGSQSAGEYFKNQRCKFTVNKRFERTRLSCTEGDSPLAGVTYEISPNKDPNDCSYAYRYVCTAGCDKAGVPRIMLQSYWECGME